MASNFLEELAADEEQAPRNLLEELASDEEPQYMAADSGASYEQMPWWKRAAKDLTNPEAWKHSLGVVARGAIEGIESPITIPADFAIAVRNKLTGSNYPSLSQLRDEELDAIGLARPQTKMEHVNSFVAGTLAGARLPVPQAANQAPAGFIAPSLSPQQVILAKGQDAGLVVPPTTANPTMLNKAAEGFAGKLSTAQQASLKNQSVFNNLAKRALGMAPDEELTPSALEGIRKTAGKVYEQIADSGDIVPDRQFLDDLARLGRGADEISKAFPGANVGANKQIGEIVDSLLQDKFSSKAALQYLRELRKMASGNLSGINAADPTKQALGMAQREAAATLEDLIGRHLEATGKGSVAAAFDGARRTIAMAHTVEDALNESTGNIIASKLAKQLGRGKPLSGDLETIAQFAQAFPKASREVVESMPGVSPLDYAAALGTALVTQSPSPLAYLTTRPTVRGALLSPWWQARLRDTPAVLRERVGVVPGAALEAAQVAAQE